MTNAGRLATDYLRRAHLREQAIDTLIAIGDFADAVRECQEAAELAVKALLKLKDIAYPRAHDVARLLRDPAIEGPLLEGPEIAEIEDASKVLRRDRELSFYGAEDVIPLEYYERKDADQALALLRRVRALVATAFERNGTPIV
jgi:HEPN domain-containing protein